MCDRWIGGGGQERFTGTHRTEHKVEKQSSLSKYTNQSFLWVGVCDFLFMCIFFIW